MNRDTIIGFALIALVLIGFSWYNSPSKEQIEAARVQDSIAAVTQEKAQKAEQQKQLAQEKKEEAAMNDSSALFYSALHGTSQQVVLKNGKVELTLDTKGGVVKKAKILDYKDLNDDKDLTLFDEKDQNLNFLLAGKNDNIITADLYFTPSEQTDSTVTMTAQAGNGGQVIIQRIFRKNKHGMDYVVLQEILEIQKMDTENEYFIFVKPGEDHCVKSTENVHVVEIACPSYPLWEQWALPRAAKKAKVDILHCTSNTAPIWCDFPLVLTLHDIIFLEPRDKQNKSLYQNLGWFYRRLDVPRILNKCQRIITVSNYEMENIINKLNIPRERMAMIYNGYNEWFRPINPFALSRPH